MHNREFFIKVWSVFTILALVLGFFPTGTARAASVDLFFSEYIEGSGFNKAVEIYNGTGAAVDLAAGGYAIQIYSNGAAIPGATLNLTGIIMPGDVFVAAHPTADAAILAQADVTSSTVINFNGDDAVALVKAGGIFVDVFGQVGFDPGAEWGSGLTSTADNTLRRRSIIEDGDPIHIDPFDPAFQWNGFVSNTFDGLGSHVVGPEPDTAPSVTAIVPINGAGSVALNQSLAITFSEPVNLADGWFTLSCSVSGSHTAVVSGGPSVFTLDPDTDFEFGDSCTFTALQAGVTDVDTNEPPDAMLADFSSTFSTSSPCVQPFTPISAIQGSGLTSPLVGSVVTTYGIVVGDYEGASPNLRGFYLQSQQIDQDADPTTSEGIFVFNANNNNFGLGDAVRLTGTVEEYQGQTQISQLTSSMLCAAPSTVMPVPVSFPVASTTALEAFEGMMVTLPQEMTVTEHFQLGRFGQVVLSANGRLMNPTTMVEPGAPALALQEANTLNKIILDDTLNNQNPDPIVFGRDAMRLSASNTLRGGDTVTGLIGVMTYTWSGFSASGNAYRIRPQNSTISYFFQPANPRPAAAPARAGSLRVSGMNVLNYFNTFTGCTLGVGGASTGCRGAENQAEFDRQWPKTVAAVIGTQADIIGLGEIENDGYAAGSAIATLVNQLNAATAAGTYAFIDADTAAGQVNALGTDAIKVGFLYKPAAVMPLGTAVLNTTAFVNGGDTTARSRPALAQTFEEVSTGARFTVVTNHLKSKSSACDLADAGDGQGNCNIVRTNAATELVDWLETDPTSSGDTDVLIIGDLNSYAKEDPIDVLLAGGFTNLTESFGGANAYSYVFDGQWGYLDHALSSTALTAQVAGVNEWHINADEPSVLDFNTNFKSPSQIATLYAPDQYRMSDHDIVLVDVNLIGGRPSAEAGGPYTVNEGSSVQLTGGGSDPDGGAVSYAWDLDNDQVFETNSQNVSFAAVDGPAAFTVNLKVTDLNGQSQTDSTTVTVNNVNPVLGVITGPRNPVVVNTTVTTSVSYSDLGVLDTHTAVWDWGDGADKASDGAVGAFNGAGIITGSHTYTEPGMYTITLTLTDKDGGSAVRKFQSVYVYESFTMQAVGKGSYISPAGSYLSNPTRGGLTLFDFNARVMRQAFGRYALTGYLNLQLKNAGMIFKSANVRWLDTAEGTAQFVGTGYLNGKRGYEYFVSVIDSPRGDVIYIEIVDSLDQIVYQLPPESVLLTSGNILVRK